MTRYALGLQLEIKMRITVGTLAAPAYRGYLVYGNTTLFKISEEEGWYGFRLEAGVGWVWILIGMMEYIGDFDWKGGVSR